LLASPALALYYVLRKTYIKTLKTPMGKRP